MSDSASVMVHGMEEGGYSLYGERGGSRSTASGGKQKDVRITIMKIIVLILSVLLLLEGIIYTFVMPCLAPVKVEFSGLQNVSSQMLMDRVSRAGGPTWIQFDSSKVVAALSGISGIDTVSVDKEFPDKVVIRVKERVCVAKTIISVNGSSIPVQIDENGVLFTTSTSDVVKDSNIPLISGLPVENMQAGMRFPARYRPLMEQIAAIQRLPQKYFAAVSEIQVVSKEYGSYELVLYPVHTQVRILTDRTLDEDVLKRMVVVLDVVNSTEPDVKEIDLRYGAISFRKH